MNEIFIPIGFFAMIFGISYLRQMTKHRENMAILDLLEKNKDLEVLKDADFFNKEKNRAASSFGFKNILLALGMIAAGSGLGIMLGGTLNHTFHWDSDIAYPSAILILIGASLLITYRVISRKDFGDNYDI